MKFSFCSFLTLSLKVEIILSEIYWTMVYFASCPLTPHFSRQVPSHQWSVFARKAKPQQLLHWPDFSVGWGPCGVTTHLAVPSWILNVSDCKIFLFEEKNMLCESKCEQACPIKAPPPTCQEKTAPSHCVGPCTVSWAWSVEFGMQMQLNVLICSQRMQGSLLAQVHLYAQSLCFL